MALLGSALRRALHLSVHRHACTGVPLGLPVGASLLRGLGPTQQWPSVATLLCSRAPLGPGTWMPSHQACAFPPVPMLCYDTHRNMLHGDSPTCGPGMSCCCTGHIPCGPTLSTCWVSSQTRPYPDNLFSNIFCTYMPHPTTHHNAHRPGSGPGPPSSVTLILYQTEPEAVERGP